MGLSKILVVDDTPANIKLLEAVLQPRGYDVLTAQSGEQALETVATEQPDLVLLDIVMPGIDGYEVCRRLRADPSTQVLPIVMITASGAEQKIKALESGADDFVTKPFDKSELLARVSSLLRIKEYHATVEAQKAELAEWNRTLEDRVQQQVQELERLSGLRRFLPPQLAEMIVSSGDESILEDHRREITVVVCALRGFTTFSEMAEPEDVLSVLHEYHSALGQIISRFEGTLDRFAADEITVFFNDPLPCSDPAGQAVRMVLEMRGRVELLARSWRKRGHELSFVAGAATGYATLGKVGFEGRFDYGAIGPVMHVAARLCEHAREGEILVAQRVKAATEKDVEAESLGDIELAGFVKPVAAYRLLGPKALRGPHGVILNPELARVTSREQTVAALVARGYSNKDIAAELVITEGTAANHVEHILNKLGFNARAQIASWATENGLYSDEADQ